MPGLNNVLNSCVERSKLWIQDPPIPKWARITILVLAILTSVILLATAIVGALALLGIHVEAFAALNSIITFVWKGLPYLMVATGGPGLLLALGSMLYGLYKFHQFLRAKNQNELNPTGKNRLEIDPNPGSSPGEPKVVTKKKSGDSEKKIKPFPVTEKYSNKAYSKKVTDDCYSTIDYTIGHYSFDAIYPFIEERLKSDKKVFLFFNITPSKNPKISPPVPEKTYVVFYKTRVADALILTWKESDDVNSDLNVSLNDFLENPDIEIVTQFDDL